MKNVITRKSHKYYNGNLYASIAKEIKNQQLFMDIYAGIAMDVKKISNYLWDLYAGIVMDVKKSIIIYETYMWVLHIWNGLMKIIVERM